MKIKKFKKIEIYKKKNKIDIKFVKHKFGALRKNYVRVKMKYSNLNYKDILTCEGAPGLVRSYPHTPGIDGAGIVQSSNSKKFVKNDRVFIVCEKIGINNHGTFSQYADFHQKYLKKNSNNISLLNTMLIGSSGLTAKIAINRILKTNKKSNLPILVTGASGNVGLSAIFFLKSINKKISVITTHRTKFNNIIKYIPDQIILREREKDIKLSNHFFKKKFSGCIDVVGGKILEKIIPLLEKKSRVVLIGMTADYYSNLNLSPIILDNITLDGINAEELDNKSKSKAWKEIEKITLNKRFPKQFYKIINFNNLIKSIKNYKKRNDFGKLIVRF